MCSPCGKKIRVDSQWEIPDPRMDFTKVYEDQNDFVYKNPVLQQLLWQRMIQDAVLSIVSIRFSQVSAFDTEPPGTSEATGFVVDSKIGLILTNRHVVCSGPFVGEAVFYNHEDVEVVPVYRDPIHDYGFLKFDPSKIKHQRIVETQLAPELARIGLEIKVVGNDAGEKLSILSGSISRIDRNVPNYGDINYNDMNTFYIQAASSTSSGSSGSPVLNIEGKAVALQAGGHTNASTDFFLPLGQVKRALKFIREGKTPPRGTIQVQFYYIPFDEMRRLGLPESRENEIRSRFPNKIGALTVEVVTPKGVAYGKLEEGDILISVEGQYVTEFLPLENILDNNINKTLKFLINRGSVDMEFEIDVIDLDSITPNRYLEIGGAKLNDVSYQFANQYCIPIEGVHVSDPSGMFHMDSAERGSIILTSFNSRKIRNLDDIIEEFKNIAHTQRVPVVYYSVLDVHTSNAAVVTAERYWFKFRLCTRNDKTGYWDFTYFDPPPEKITASLDCKCVSNSEDTHKALVKIVVSMPLKLEGFPSTRKLGAGVILDKNRGFVLTSRAIVPTSFSTILITFSETIELRAQPLFFHPTHNFVILKYDTNLLHPSFVSEVTFSKEKVKVGERLNLVALKVNLRPVSTSTTVTDISPMNIPSSSIPRYRAYNFNCITIDTNIAHQCLSGFLANEKFEVKAFWLTFLGERKEPKKDVELELGIEANCVQKILKILQENKGVNLRGLQVEVVPLQLCQALNMGVSVERINQIENLREERSQMFMVSRTLCKSEQILNDIDIIIEIDNKLVTQISALELDYSWKPVVEVTVLRNKQEIRLNVPTTEFKSEDIDKVFVWAGGVIHKTHPAILMQAKLIPSEIVVVHRFKGSPFYMYGIATTHFITSLNGVEVKTLEEFISVAKGLPDETYVRVRTVGFDLIPSMVTIKLCNHYWPPSEYVRDYTSPHAWREVC